MNDAKNTGSNDRGRNNLRENYEVEYWSNKFGVSTHQLRKVVAAMGTTANQLEKYFKK